MGALDDGSGSCRRNEAWINCSSCINAVPDRVGESYRTSVPSLADLWASRWVRFPLPAPVSFYPFNDWLCSAKCVANFFLGLGWALVGREV
jgi:hypothetical protein